MSHASRIAEAVPARALAPQTHFDRTARSCPVARGKDLLRGKTFELFDESRALEIPLQVQPAGGELQGGDSVERVSKCRLIDVWAKQPGCTEMDLHK